MTLLTDLGPRVLPLVLLLPCMVLPAYSAQDEDPKPDDAPPVVQQDGEESTELETPEAIVAPQALSAPPMGYSGLEALEAELKTLANGNSHLLLSSLGQSPGGKAIWVLTVRAKDAAAGGPEAMVVANLEGDRIAATEMAVGMLRSLAHDPGFWTDSGTLHVVPVANPDGFAQAMAGNTVFRGAPHDDDRDGRVDEDGPTDLNGDGHITWLRIPSPAGEYFVSKDDARDMQAVELGPIEGQRYRMHREGHDVDGDRKTLEDGPGGIQVDANFPHRWQQYAVPAGPYPLSEPESKGLAEFVLARPSLAWIWVLDDEDRLNHLPKGQDKTGIDSTEPLKEDARWLKLWGERWGDMDAAKAGESEINAPGKSDHGRGNFADWAYYQRGILVLESAVWSMPSEGKGKSKKHSSEIVQRDWSALHYAAGAFQEWTPFDHPQLGSVEIGGWMPLVHHNPPSEWLAPLTAKHVEFLHSMAGDFARLEWTDIEWNSLDGEGVVEVRAKLINAGTLPTTSAMGVRTRSVLPVRTELRLPAGARILVGRAQASTRQLIQGGDSEEFHWILQVPTNGPKPTLFAAGPTSGQAEITIE